MLPILTLGVEDYASVGTADSTGTRLFCLSGHVERPGVYEHPHGVTLGEVIEAAGGVRGGAALKAVLLGGAAGGFVGPDRLDARMTFEDARAGGYTLGSGVVMLFDEGTDLVDLCLRIARFFRDESCGQCVPCRVGTVRQEEALHRLVDGGPLGSRADELALLSDVGPGHARCLDLRARSNRSIRGAVRDRRVRTVRHGGRLMSAIPVDAPRMLIDVEIDGETVRVPEGATILDACRTTGVETPTMCYADNLTPINACRVCVVEVEGSRVLVPACSRRAEAGMKIATDTERVRHSRKLVMEFLDSSVDTALAGDDWHRWQGAYEADPARFGAVMAPMAAGERDARTPGHHHDPDPAAAETVAQPVKVDNELYVRDYGRCVLCYKCVEACGTDAQHTFAIAVAGRGFDARISTEYAVPLDESACVYCGNCIGVCPTGALMFSSEHAMREAGTWDEARPDRDKHDLPVLRRGMPA